MVGREVQLSGEPTVDPVVPTATILIGDPEKVEDRYWKASVGTTDLSARGYRSYWD